MPARSKAQQQLMGADLARARAGKKTRTGMSESQLRDFAATPTKGLPTRVKLKTPAGKKAIVRATRGRR
jgi:hypothetical protein